MLKLPDQKNAQLDENRGSRGLFNRSPSTPPAPLAKPSLPQAPTATQAAASNEVKPPAQSASTPAEEPSVGNRLLVGPDVKLKGAEILDCDTLVVEGRVEATMDSHHIKIAERGTFSGTVSIDTAEIHGNFEGELTARTRLVIHATGRVAGKIRYGKLLIEEGGQISGDIQSTASAHPGTTTMGQTLTAAKSAIG